MQASVGRQNLDARRAGTILLFQLLITVLLAALGLFMGRDAALSALLGGAVASIGNAVFAVWVFARYKAQDPGKMVMRFYGGELFKLAAIIAMFAAIFYWVESLMPAVFLLAFFVSQVLAPLLAHSFSD
ncbi:MAG: ATP synthase subunit I [bacterium]